MPPTNQELIDMAMDLVESDSQTGICHSCGELKDNCEPDAREYTCDECGQAKVYGAEETLLMLSSI